MSIADGYGNVALPLIVCTSFPKTNRIWDPVSLFWRTGSRSTPGSFFKPPDIWTDSHVEL